MNTTNYYRVMLGRSSSLASECIAGGFIGAHYDLHQDLTDVLTDDFRRFNEVVRPILECLHPEMSKIAAGLASGTIWTIGQQVKIGDIILSPDGSSSYVVGRVTSDYHYREGEVLPHRRSVEWSPSRIPRDAMSAELKNGMGQGTCTNITPHAEEIRRLMEGLTTPPATDGSAAATGAVFTMEKYLEDFLVKNWANTELGQKYDIYEEDGEQVGQQYQTDTGPLDILAVSKDGKELLVVELKKGRASDAVVGQIQRYMGYVLDLAEPHQTVRGAIIALEDDLRIRRALRVASKIDFYRYEISFSLVKNDV